jgi:methylated-DNA-[protein]-cysteine S-methyltransferase
MKYSAATVQTSYASPLGRMLLAANGGKLAGAWFEGQRHLPDSAGWAHVSEHPVLQSAQAQLAEYFAAHRTVFDLPLDLSSGTVFQQNVWCALLRIKYGITSSYGALSAAMGVPTALRAVGAAIGRNPFSIIVPCHRVLGKSGALTGYAGGLERKAALLQLEGAL